MSKPYDKTATPEQRGIILDFFKGYTVKQLAERYRDDENNKILGASGKKIKISLSEARFKIEQTLLHISWE